MAYQSLYRRYRPLRFSDVRGQEHVIRALRNAVRDERLGHAYLFGGPRGTGKTSTARILAKALNCEHLVEGEPDGTCDSCLAIDAGTSYDVQELDAASNNGVEKIRELISRVALSSPGRTKVYILDEVHMLSAGASAALLKTLEEPPGHVVFVLATTDPQKVLPTIRSRTQQFDFHLLSVEELSEHVAWVIHDADLGLPADVIDHVVRAGAGSARDTLSELDQVAAAGGVIEAGPPLDDLLDAVVAADAGAALVAVAAAISAGRDSRVLGEEVLARLRDIFLFRMGGATDHLMADDVERVRAWADRLSARATTRALETMGEALAEMRQAPDPRIPLEVAMVKITRPDADASLEGLIARVATLEAALASGSVAAPPVPSAGPSTSTNPSTDPAVMLDPASGASGPPDATTADRSGPPPPSRPSRPSGRPDPTSGRPTVLPSRPAPPPRPARPGDGARAQLAANRGDRATAPGHDRSVEPGSAGGPPPTSAPAVDSSAVAPGPATQAPPSDQANPTEPTIPAGPAPASSPAPETPAESADGTAAEPPETSAQKPAGTEEASVVADSEALPDRDEVITLWNETVLPSLGGLTKAMYAVGRITEVTASTAVLAFPNDVHRQKCQQKQAEVERALSNALGRPVELRLVVDSSGDQGDPSNAGGGDRNSSSGRGGTLANDDDLDLTGADVHDLDDAPGAPAGGIDALTQAFPGSELVEGS